jgi:hypothetical protein
MKGCTHCKSVCEFVLKCDNGASFLCVHNSSIIKNGSSCKWECKEDLAQTKKSCTFQKHNVTKKGQGDSDLKEKR